MDWKEARYRIETHVRVGTDLNTKASTYRFVDEVDAPIKSDRYGYDNERGFVVPIGQSNKIKIPWSMLEACFYELGTPDGYSTDSFRERFPLQYKDHPCHVHVVGQIFAIAGIAEAEGNRYRAIVG